jgi:hypothetical protein
LVYLHSLPKYAGEVETSNSIFLPFAYSIDFKFGHSLDLDTANVHSAAPGAEHMVFLLQGTVCLEISLFVYENSTARFSSNFAGMFRFEWLSIRNKPFGGCSVNFRDIGVKIFGAHANIPGTSEQILLKLVAYERLVM